MKKIIIIILILFINSSCATKALWEKTGPKKYVKIKYTEITEKELKNKGTKYIKDDEKHAFYVEKSSYEKFKNYSARVLGTPVTIVVDAASIVVFAVAFAIADNTIDEAREEGCERDPNCNRYP